MSETSRGGYDAFAPIYDRHWCAPAAKRFFFSMRPLLPPPPATVLDLCCGTGRLAERLLQAGYQVWGVDLSSEMIRLARQNAPTGTFIVADARDFSLEVCFDAVLCTFDSLNHMLTDAALAEVFACVHRHMAPHAVFAFDVNTPHKYERAWEGTFEVEQELSVCATYDAQTQRATFVGLLPGGQRFELIQRPLTREVIRAALSATGLEIKAVEVITTDATQAPLRERYVVHYSGFGA